MSLSEELRSLQFDSYSTVFRKFNDLSAKYGNLSSEKLISAFSRVTGATYEWNNPYIQNRRVKAISTLPADYSKDKVSEMLVNAGNNEQPLRAVDHALEITAYPLFHLRKVYQDLLTYHSYTSPELHGAERGPSEVDGTAGQHAVLRGSRE